MADAADLAGKLGFPEWKVAVALARRRGDANRAAEYLFTHGDKDDGFWRDQAPSGGAAAAPAPAPMGYISPLADRTANVGNVTHGVLTGQPEPESATQEDRIEALRSHLVQIIEIPDTSALTYAQGLVAEGFDTPELVDRLSLEVLRSDFGFKRGHACKVEKHRLDGVARAGDGSGSTETGQPVGAALPDGSMIELLDTLLGRGASGIVREAKRTRRSGATEIVAAKMLAAGSSEQEKQKFAKEFDVSLHASQHCAGACRIYGLVVLEGELCIIMKKYQQNFAELLESHRDVQDASKRAPLSHAELFEFGLQILCALSELHVAGILVQDLKPSNLLIDENGKLVVADFGIAVLSDATFTSSGTRAGAGGGTLAYMAPEQHDSDLGRASPKTDLWAWACVMSEAASGVVPWQGQRHAQIMTNILIKKKIPTIPASLPQLLQETLRRCFAHAQHERPDIPEVAATLRTLTATAPARDAPLLLDPRRATTLHVQGVGTEAYTHADSLLQNTWIKREEYAFSQLVEVRQIDNPRLQQRYDAYKAAMPAEVLNGNEVMVFHGCKEAAVKSIVEHGFKKEFWRSAAGDWQRFGPGFYFALQASKSHEYPLDVMRALSRGEHTRTSLLCKVAKGTTLQTTKNMDGLQGAAPAGYHSIHGLAAADGPLNYDELVVYDEAAVLPYATVTYRFIKCTEPGSKAAAVPQEAGGGGGGGGGGGAAGGGAPEARRTPQQEAIAQFVGICGADETQAQTFLQANGWDLQRAAHRFFTDQARAEQQARERKAAQDAKAKAQAVRARVAAAEPAGQDLGGYRRPASKEVSGHGWDAYIANMQATGQVEDGAICGLDGTVWTDGGLALTAEEAAALVNGFDDPSGLRNSGIVVAGTKFTFIQLHISHILPLLDNGFITGKLGKGGITIFKMGQALLIGTYNGDMTPGNNVKEVGKFADYLREVGY